MLVVNLSIAVETKDADEVRNYLMDELGVQIVNEESYTEKLCFAEPVTRVYLDCFVPKSRIEYVTDYLDNVFAGTAIITY